jgi:HSP20 family protein
MEEVFAPFVWPTEETLSVTGWTPSCDVYETDNEIVIKAELPGVKKEDAKVGIQDGLLTISGERKFEEETKKENYLRVERSYGSFTRSFTLPTRVDQEKVLAEFKDGLLQVTLPKREEAKPKGVEVKVK